MKSRPREVDVRPDQLVMWLTYHLQDGGLLDLPAHMLVTSRGGDSKHSHFALICERQEEIDADGNEGTINPKRVVNLVSGKPLGGQQVTAMVRYDPEPFRPERPYPVLFRAKMFREGFVRLGGKPVPLVGSLLAAYEVLCGTGCADDWISGVTDLKYRARASLNPV
jgi:hypothetical protein